MHFAASPSVPFANPHNALLQLAAEWGVPVVLIVLALFLWGVTRWPSHRRSASFTEEQPDLRVALFAALLTSALYSLFDGIIVMPVSQLLLALIIGWMLGVMPAGPDTSRPVSRIRTMVAGLLLAVVLIGVLRPVFSTVLCLEQLQADYIHAHPQATHLNPRFWQQGYLSGYTQASSCR
jgi:O-antigen ligase